jgi:peptidoglycan/LPS O-acetylase OafA/YrhL
MKFPSLNFSFKHNSKSDISSIILMRGIASLMVCFFHFSYGNKKYLPEDNVIRLVGQCGRSGVEIFFIISGFIIPYSMFIKKYTLKNIGSFFLKRAIRIEPPYIISIFIVLALGYISSIMPGYSGKPFSLDWMNVAGHVAYLNAFTGDDWLLPVYWTLAVEFQYYIIIALCFALLISEKQYLRYLFFIPFVALVLLKPMLPFFIVSFTPYFMIGILLFQFYCSIISAKECLLLLMITTAILFYNDGVLLTAIAAITVLLIVLIKKIHPFFLFLGTISYSLYLIHIPIGGRFINLFTKLSGGSILSKEIIIFAAIAFVLPVAYLYYRLVEKRFKNMASGIKYNTSAA